MNWLLNYLKFYNVSWFININFFFLVFLCVFNLLVFLEMKGIKKLRIY